MTEKTIADFESEMNDKESDIESDTDIDDDIYSADDIDDVDESESIKPKKDGHVDTDELLLTKKEIKLLRKKERERKKKLLKDDDSEESEEYSRIKKKLDNIPDVLGRDDKSDVIARENVMNTLSQKLDRQPQQNIPQSHQIQQTPINPMMQYQTRNVPDLVAPKQSHEAGRVIQNQVAAPPMDESGDVDLNKLFSSEVGNESDVVKELFTSENIKVKTDLSENEISIISRLELQASMTQNFFLTKILKELEILRVSKDRKSRSEFVQSFSGIKEQSSGVTAFGKLGNIFKNDKV